MQGRDQGRAITRGDLLKVTHSSFEVQYSLTSAPGKAVCRHMAFLPEKSAKRWLTDVSKNTCTFRNTKLKFTAVKPNFINQY